jgi:hypothetical protein
MTGGRLIKVEGRAVLDGIPLSGAHVTFVPTTPGMPRAEGHTSIEGYFRLTTYEKDDGVYAGDYKVIVTLTPHKRKEPKRDPDTGEVEAEYPMARPDVRIPASYEDVAKTPLEVQIPSRQKVVLELHKYLRE